LGLFTKIVIADNLSPFVDDFFKNYHNYSGSTLLLGAIFLLSRSMPIFPDIQILQLEQGNCLDSTLCVILTILTFQETLLNSGKSGTYHLQPGSEIIYSCRFPSHLQERSIKKDLFLLIRIILFT